MDDEMPFDAFCGPPAPAWRSRNLAGNAQRHCRSLQMIARLLGGEVSAGRSKLARSRHGARGSLFECNARRQCAGRIHCVNTFSPADDPDCLQRLRSREAQPSCLQAKREMVAAVLQMKMLHAHWWRRLTALIHQQRLLISSRHTSTATPTVHYFTKCGLEPRRVSDAMANGGWIWKLDDRRVAVS